MRSRQSPEMLALRLERLRHLRETERKKAELSVTLARYHDDPVGFARDCINWGDRELAPYQAEIMELLQSKRRASFRSLRGAGKSCCAAIIILWFAMTREACKEDWKIVSTAGSWGQLRNFLWPEIHKWSARMKWDIVREGRRFTQNELQRINLKLEHGAAIAAACTNAGLIEGAHADEVLFVFDEAKLIPADTFDSAEGAMNTGNCYAIMLSTPGEPAGRFYEVQSRQKGYEDWGVKAVTLPEVMATGQVNPDWVKQRRMQWGEESALFHNHVLGEFFAADEDCVIPLRWAEAAVERWRQWEADGSKHLPGRRVVACDVARYGVDKTAIAIRQGTMVERIEQHSQADTMKTTGYVKGYSDYPQSMAVIDVIGVGSGVVDRLRELGQQTVGFNGAARAVFKSGFEIKDRTGEFGFVNMRAASWFMLREAWDPSTFPPCHCGRDQGGNNCYMCSGALGIPENVQLMGDLTAPHWAVTSGSKYKIESKDEIRKRLGRSTDLGDAIVMAAWYSGAVGDPDLDRDTFAYTANKPLPSEGLYAYDDDVENMYKDDPGMEEW